MEVKLKLFMVMNAPLVPGELRYQFSRCDRQDSTIMGTLCLPADAGLEVDREYSVTFRPGDLVPEADWKDTPAVLRDCRLEEKGRI